MDSLRQLPELQNMLTELDDKRCELDEFLCQVTDVYDALCEAGSDGYEPGTEAERALAYLSRYTTVAAQLRAKVSFMTNIFIDEVKEIIESIENMGDECQ